MANSRKRTLKYQTVRESFSNLDISDEEETQLRDVKRRKEISFDSFSLGLNVIKFLPNPFANEFVTVIEEVMKRVETAKDNKEYCQELLDRLICAAETIVIGLKNAPSGREP